jgi:hypothetical protein
MPHHMTLANVSQKTSKEAAPDFLGNGLYAGVLFVELKGIEPLTSSMPWNIFRRFDSNNQERCHTTQEIFATFLVKDGHK